MGKILNQQRRGKGSMTWRSPRHKYGPKVSFKDVNTKAVVVELLREAQRSAPQAIIEFEDGAAIIPAAHGLFVGQIIDASENAEIKAGNIIKLKDVPEGEQVFCMELIPGDGGKLVRGAGGNAVVMSKSDSHVRVKMPSGRTKDMHPNCRAILGVAAGSGIASKPILKAGKMFHMMKAKHTYWPIVAASSMNAAEHPFGGGRKHRHGGKPQTISRHAPPGQKVGYIAASKTGRSRGKEKVMNMVKKYFYKGISEDELPEISIEDFKKIAPSRIRRTLERGFTPAQKRLIERIKKVRDKNIQKPLRTQCRNMPVLPIMMGLTIMIHNGKDFTPIVMNTEKLGHFLGEFTLTRRRIAHSAPGVGATRSSKFVPLK